MYSLQYRPEQSNVNEKSILLYDLFQYIRSGSLLEKIIDNNIDFNVKNFFGHTLLHYIFVYCESEEILLNLLKRKNLDFTIKNISGLTPFDFAINYCKFGSVKEDVYKYVKDHNIKF